MIYLKHVVVPKQINLLDPCDNPYTISKISAIVADMTDEAIYQAIIKMAREEGITDLYLMDKKFVFDALKEKLEKISHQEV